MRPAPLDYATPPRRRRWVAKAVAVVFFTFGLFVVVSSARLIFGPPVSTTTTADQAAAVREAWKSALFGAVLMIPALCVAAGWVGNESLVRHQPGGSTRRAYDDANSPPPSDRSDNPDT